jgi:hypothetical protein
MSRKENTDPLKIKPMSEKEKFKRILKYLELSYKDLAEILDLTPDSVRALINHPQKALPRWGKMMVYMYENLVIGKAEEEDKIIS